MKRLFVCNQMKCKRCSGMDFGQCFHTTERAYAKPTQGPRFFHLEHGTLIEREGDADENHHTL